MLINPYSPGIIFKNFPDLDAKIAKHYNRVFDTATTYHISPRYLYEVGLKLGFRDTFYYIDTLYDHHPESVIDVGCGECIWKNWFPNIIGFDPNTNEFSQQDFVDYFDADFSQHHHKTYDSGMALNSLHFVNWANVGDQIDLAMNIVKDRFLFTFNFAAMRNTPPVKSKELIPLFDDIIKSLSYEIILLDYPELRGFEEILSNSTCINGHVRFILAHKENNEH